MLTPVAQRWRDRRGSYRPIGEVFDPRSHEVAELPTDTLARAFVERHHYSGTYPAARFRFGLHEGPALVGVAVFSVPMNDAALRPLPGDPRDSLELGRFVLLNSVRANGESWFLARCLEVLRRRGLVGVVTFADPEPRTSVDGAVTFAGHIGGIYQASSAIYLGRATARTLRVLPDGAVVSARALQKIRAGERGWKYAVEQLVAHGAPEPANDDLRAWLAAVLPTITRTMRHGGNHKYVIALDRGARKSLRALDEIAYPKFELPEAP